MGIFDRFRRPPKIPEATPRQPELQPPESIIKEPRAILYDPPCIMAFKAGGRPVSSDIEEFSRGRYFLSASGDRVRLFALLYSNESWGSVIRLLKHRALPDIIEKLQGTAIQINLGGGLMEADHDNRTLKLFDYSIEFGIPPAPLIISALSGTNYLFTVDAPEKAKGMKSEATKW